ncbi:hypothetical protein A5668_26175 [Mycolicibacterium fortuitum]|uniref:hypothetical protein n=1 Tax=Mycolicibacterium fortuitum TaxID=1766 RepID=UPI0007EA7996|nr:hypothetical protein [Mycolicibacterium fortuitum]OBB00172.1 hypothetical protein A5668_26175 [Mycolicibacterium fortuitum]
MNLTAAANPLQLWADVIGSAFENVSGLGEQLAADPAPILRQIIANQLHSANVLGTATQKLADGLAQALDPDYFLSFPAALKQSFDLIAAGDLQGGLSTLPTSILMLGLPLLDFVGNEWAPGAWSVIAQPFTNLAHLVTKLPEGTPALLLNGLISPMAATAAATGYVLENLIAATNTGDVAEAVATLVNSPATITGALLNGFEMDSGDGMPPTVFTGLLNPPDGFLPGGAISTVLNTLSQIADSMATPGADRDNLFGSLPTVGASSQPASVNAALAPAAKAVTLDIAPAKEISAAPAATQPVSAVEAPASTDAGQASADTDDTTEAATKLSAKASPKAAQGQSKASSAKAVRTQVKSAVKKLTDGLKKDKTSSPKPAQRKTDSSSDSGKGSEK